jgi:hypothetical protein
MHALFGHSLGLQSVSRLHIDNSTCSRWGIKKSIEAHIMLDDFLLSSARHDCVDVGLARTESVEHTANTDIGVYMVVGFLRGAKPFT